MRRLEQLSAIGVCLAALGVIYHIGYTHGRRAGRAGAQVEIEMIRSSASKALLDLEALRASLRGNHE